MTEEEKAALGLGNGGGSGNGEAGESSSRITAPVIGTETDYDLLIGEENENGKHL